MKSLATFLVFGLILAGCGGEPEAPPVIPDDTTIEEIPVVAVTPEKDIGDLEAGIKFEVTLDAENQNRDLGFEEMRAQTQKLTMGTITVEGSRPETIPIAIDFETQLEFPERPVAARGRLIRELESGEKETIYTFETVFDDNASVRRRRVDGDFPPQHFEADALQGLAELPETMLLYGEMDVVMMPEGTDPATIEPATASGAPEDTGMLISNPVRVNFNIAAPAPAPVSPASPDAPAPGAPEQGESPPADAVPAPDVPAAPEVAPAPEAAPETAPADAAPAPEAPADDAEPNAAAGN